MLRCERRQHLRFDTGSEGAGWGGPTEASLAIVHVAPGALRDRVPPTCSRIPDEHVPPTSSAEYEPLEEGRPLPGHTTSPPRSQEPDASG
jgi:hypothetical protein